MVAVDAQLAMLAAQCMLTLVAIPPPAAAIAVRSPHATHGEVAGPLHHQRHSVMPLPAEKKYHSSKGSHDSKSASKHQGREHSTVSQESSDSENHSLLSESASSLETAQPREQRTFQTRDLLSRDMAIVSSLKPLLEQALDALKPILGDLPLVGPVLEALRPIIVEILDDAVGITTTLGARHHHDHYVHDHYREKIIIDDDSRPLHEYIHARTHFEHTQLSNGERGTRGLGPVRGIIAAVNKNFEVVTFLSADDSSSELTASRGSATAFYLDEVPWLSSLTQGNPVMLRVEQANTASDGSGERCATYDPNPPLPSTLKLTRCFVSANNATEHADQVFSLDPKSNQLQPMSSDNTTSTDVRMNARDDDGLPDDVMLVFQQAPAIAAEAPPTSSDARYQASLTTVTVTTTATETESSTIAADAALPSTTTGSSSSPFPSSTSQSSPASLDVEVALPSVTPSGTESSPKNDTASFSSTPSASGSTTAEVSPSPVSLLFEVKEKWNTVSGSTMTV